MRWNRRYYGKLLFIGRIVLTSVLFFFGSKAVVATSTNEFCAACHIHLHSTDNWKISTHYANKRGIQVHCVDCHLPPYGEGYLPEKVKAGVRDVWGKLFKDPESLNWEEMMRSDIKLGPEGEIKLGPVNMKRVIPIPGSAPV